MSLSSKRGKDFELKVARILRSKLGARIQRDKRSGAGINKSDISDYHREIPLHMELKDHETIKIKEFFRQAKQGASVGQAPTVVFACDGEILACLRFDDLVNFLAEIKDQQAEIGDMRKPIPTRPSEHASNTKEAVAAIVSETNPLVKKLVSDGAQTCRNGHIADHWGYCMQVQCPYSRGYKKPKGKKS